MDVILDSNILIEDRFLRNPYFKLLIEYVNRKGSKIILPEIVLIEVEEHFRRSIDGQLKSVNNKISTLNGSVGNEFSVEKVKLDIDGSLKTLMNRITAFLALGELEVIPIKGEHLQELVIRGARRVKPMGPNGQQFRDCAIWLSCVDFASEHKRRCVLISTNVNDFGNGNKPDKKTGESQLHPELKKELELKSCSIHYCQNLDDFSKFIADDNFGYDLDKLKPLVDEQTLENALISFLDKRDASEMCEYLDTFIHPLNERLTGYYEINAITSKIDYSEFHVNQIKDEELLITVECFAEVEIMYEVEKNPFHSNKDYSGIERIKLSDIDNFEGIHSISNIDSSYYDHCYPNMMFSFAMRVKGNELIKLEINKADF